MESLVAIAGILWALSALITFSLPYGRAPSNWYFDTLWPIASWYFAAGCVVVGLSLLFGWV